MKFPVGFLFFFWLLMTIILTFSVIGLILFIPNGFNSRSTWMEIGFDLKDKIINYTEK
jgi:hypothetical protein